MHRNDTVTRPAPLISADFDSGNIEVIDARDPLDVHLAIRPDRQSAHFQWFHFKAAALQVGQRYAFRLQNAAQSSYGNAWHGYHAVASCDQRTWFRVPSTFDGQALRFGLEAQNTDMWFAYFEPYSRQRHDALIDRAVMQAGLQLLAVGHSCEGRKYRCCARVMGRPASVGSGLSPSSIRVNTWRSGSWKA